MGWWQQNEEGLSFVRSKNGEMVWGDVPADIIDNALDEVVKEFEAQWSRKPTESELRAGLEFSLGGGRYK